MTDDSCRRPDEGRVLSTALAAVMLIAAGLGLMFWDDRQDARKGAVTVSVLHHP
jgi:hypothetical protein